MPTGRDMSWWHRLLGEPKQSERRFSEPRLVVYRCRRMICPICCQPFEDGETVVRVDVMDEASGRDWLDLTHVRCAEQLGTPSESDGTVDTIELSGSALSKLVG